MHLKSVLYSSTSSPPIRSNTFYITVYGLIGAATAVLMLCRGVTMAFGVVRASSSLHLDMLTSVLRAPSRFFDATPSGRVLNRFSKDVDDVDTFVPMMVRREVDIRPRSSLVLFLSFCYVNQLYP